MAMLKTMENIFLLLLFLCSLTHSANAQLLGDWGGIRQTLDQHGITTDAVLTTDLLYNAAGGLD